MKKLLLPGIKLKRWVLLLFLGILGFIVFIIITFADEYIYSPKLLGEVILLLVSAIFLALAIRGLISYFVNALLPEKKGKIWNILYKHSDLARAPKIVVIGGGTGLNSILSGLKKYTNNITAVVSVSDEGGSSRKMRHEFGVLPPGDVRHCIVALSDAGPLMSKLLEYRFKEGKGFKGHSFGNLLITALTKITGSFDKAIKETGQILAIRGKVLPVTLADTRLCAQLENGKIIEQEPNVEAHKTKYKSEIKRLFLKPANAAVYPEAAKEIKKADIVVLGPGSLYTSILPNILVRGVPEAIKKSKGKIVYVCNVMTQPGETDNYKASDHVGRVIRYLGKDVLDYAVVNSERAPEKLYWRYRKKGATRVKLDEDNLKKFNIDIVKADLITKKDLLRHDPDKLAKVVVGLA